ncbi:MAG: hypothetical protein M5U27_15105 [Gaiella sp.]|nr:hypothetical protein [Gaiella sp.]
MHDAAHPSRAQRDPAALRVDDVDVRERDERAAGLPGRDGEAVLEPRDRLDDARRPVD